ncbi:hypothetical protein [Methylocella sp.]|uniref:hypothetical protein n=1 Tax=Methylocella sp. TaxID=1978226 RepID=UPI003784B597
MGYPSVVMAALLAIGFFGDAGLLFRLFFATSAFTSLSLLPPDAIGGLSLLPQTVLVVLLFGRIALDPRLGGRAAAYALDFDKFGLLFAFLAAAVVISVISPNLFAGQIRVIPIRLEDDFQTGQLAFSTTNLTQCAYLATSVLAGLSISVLATQPGFRDKFVSALLLGGIVVVLSGVADLVFADSGVLKPFRNASYAILDNSATLGVRRLIGLAPESSTFGWNGAFFASMLLFLRPAVEKALTRAVMLATAGALALMVVLSTSTTGYLWLISIVMWYFIDFGVRGFTPTRDRRASARVGAELLTLICLLLATIAVFAMMDTLYAQLSDFLDAILFKKTATVSYQARSFWNATSLSAFVASHGLGVGVGSTRSSSGYVALAATTGVVGASIIALFITQTLMTKGYDESSEAFVKGVRLALVSALLPWALAGNVDFGANIGAMFGAVIGVAAARPARARPPAPARRERLAPAREPDPAPARVRRSAPAA